MNTTTRNATLKTMDGFKAALNAVAQKREEEQISLRLNHQQNIQEAIYKNCEIMDNGFHDMVRLGEEAIVKDVDINKNKKEQANFYNNVDQVVDESQRKRMRNRIIAYYFFPFADILLALFAIYPVATSKFMRDIFPNINEKLIVPCGILLSVVIGVIVTLVGRFNEPDTQEKNPKHQIIKYIRLTIAILLLPVMYIVSDLIFSEGGGISVYGCFFACFSFVIQISMISQYKRHMEAFNYMRLFKERDALEAKLSATARQLKEEKNNIRQKFEQIYRSFSEASRSLISNIDDYMKISNQQPVMPLSQTTILFSNLKVFGGREAISFFTNQDGTLSKIALDNSDIPENYNGYSEIVKSDDFVCLDYMFKGKLRELFERSRIGASNQAQEYVIEQ